ncbi:hypothetical protein BJ965_000923 [Streptomyces luteogriseus]|uniref:Uncharacterized protein n=1 Tax=Streptomyces luteogriseus TaxID=68233 RepID=A0A7W7DI02_9ACTN|nr:hypothetical protein [Streptomyces luteogriseus]
MAVDAIAKRLLVDDLSQGLPHSPEKSLTAGSV